MQLDYDANMMVIRSTCQSQPIDEAEKQPQKLAISQLGSLERHSVRLALPPREMNG